MTRQASLNLVNPKPTNPNPNAQTSEPRTRALGQGVFFFVVAPFCSCPASLVSRKFFAVGPGCAKCFFLLRSVGRRDLSAGPEQKKTPPRVFFFFCSGPGERQGKEKPRWAPARGFSLSPGPEQKKKHHAHSLTAGLGGDASPSPRGVFFFFAAAPPGPGWCFFFAVAPPGRSLTHCGLGRFRQGPGGVFFFAAAPPGLFRQ